MHVPSAAESLARGKAHHEAGQLHEAAEWYQRAIEADPESSEAHFLKGVVHVGLGKLDDAIASLAQAVRLRPLDAAAHNELGLVLAHQGKLDEAIASLQRAWQLNPRSAEISANLRRTLATSQTSQGNACFRQGKLDEAATFYRSAVELQPDLAEAHNNLGAVFEKQQQVDEAIACYRRAVEIKPDYADAHNSLGVLLVRQAKLPEAIACYRRALELNPDNADAHFHLGLALLLVGDFAAGWPEYEWRLKQPATPLEPLPQPRWTDSDLAGKTILLRAEQGHGDTLQFIRYAEIVKQRGGTVIVECPARLTRLIARCAGVDRVVAKGEPLLAFDVHLPLMSLPGVLRTSLDNIPAKIPYVWPDDEAVCNWHRELGPPRGLRIGIAWQGSAANPLDHFRSIPLAEFAPIARTPGVELYSLQMGAGREQVAEFATRYPLVDLADLLGDFDNTAALVQNLDLVITCCSAPAHLAGALGVPVWVALPFAADWRWLLDRDDTPWYPTMRLFRQTCASDWAGVFERIERALAELVASKGC